MATRADVRRIAMALPGAKESEERFAFSVSDGKKDKGFAWVWLERIHPKKARVPQPKVLAVRVADQVEKDMLLAMDGEKFFTEPHYDGYPAVLVRLPLVTTAELREVLTCAWRCMAPKKRIAELDEKKKAARSRKTSARRLHRPSGSRSRTQE